MLYKLGIAIGGLLACASLYYLFAPSKDNYHQLLEDALARLRLLQSGSFTKHFLEQVFTEADVIAAGYVREKKQAMRAQRRALFSHHKMGQYFVETVRSIKELKQIRSQPLDALLAQLGIDKLEFLDIALKVGAESQQQLPPSHSQAGPSQLVLLLRHQRDVLNSNRAAIKEGLQYLRDCLPEEDWPLVGPALAQYCQDVAFLKFGLQPEEYEERLRMLARSDRRVETWLREVVSRVEELVLDFLQPNEEEDWQDEQDQEDQEER